MIQPLLCKRRYLQVQISYGCEFQGECCLGNIPVYRVEKLFCSSLKTSRRADFLDRFTQHFRKIWQIFKHFARPFHQAYTSYFWRVYQYCLIIYTHNPSFGTIFAMPVYYIVFYVYIRLDIHLLCVLCPCNYIVYKSKVPTYYPIIYVPT